MASGHGPCSRPVHASGDEPLVSCDFYSRSLRIQYKPYGTLVLDRAGSGSRQTNKQKNRPKAREQTRSRLEGRDRGFKCLRTFGSSFGIKKLRPRSKKLRLARCGRALRVRGCWRAHSHAAHTGAVPRAQNGRTDTHRPHFPPTHRSCHRPHVSCPPTGAKGGAHQEADTECDLEKKRAAGTGSASRWRGRPNMCALAATCAPPAD